MDSGRSPDWPAPDASGDETPAAGRTPAGPPIPVKVVVSGGFGVGKTTTVGAISEIAPLTTEAEMTAVSVGVDEPGTWSAKSTTTVAMDFGCVTIDRSLKLYLFGTPGQSRFGFMWDDLSRGALGALVVVDSSRLDDCYPAVDYFERADLPFVVAFDARDRLSVRDTLLVLLDRALDRTIRTRAS